MDDNVPRFLWGSIASDVERPVHSSDYVRGLPWFGHQKPILAHPALNLSPPPQPGLR